MQSYALNVLQHTIKRPFFPCMAIVQARMGSTRLPGKVLKEVLGKPLLFYLVERLREVPSLDGIIIATTQNSIDDPIARFCDSESLHCVRASEENVLERYVTASSLFDLQVLVRVTSDCPIIDPQLIEKGLQLFAAHYDTLDYLSNTLSRTFPRGMDFEIMKSAALSKAYFEATIVSDKEHVTPFIINHPDQFRLGNITQDVNTSNYRLTVDHEEDFLLIKQLIESLYPKNPLFTLEDIQTALRAHPEWVQLNAHVTQK